MAGRTGPGAGSGNSDLLTSLQRAQNLINLKFNGSPITRETLEEYTNRDKVVKIYCAGVKEIGTSDRVWVWPTFTGYHDHTASAPVTLEKGNLVGIKDLMLMENVNQVMKGKFFLCRTITPSSKAVAEVEMVVEDPEGKNAVILALYNYSEKAAHTDFEGVVPKGAYLVVKNPWFTSTVDREGGGVILRCDNPGNVEMISEKEVEDKFPDCKWRPIPHEEIPSYFWDQMTKALYSDEDRMKKLKDIGNKSYREKRFTDAIRWYKMGLDYANEPADRFTILNNMKAALMGMECWNAALKCVKEALQINGADEKALYRKGKCLMGLEKWEEAINFLEDLEGSEALKKLLGEAREHEKIYKNPEIMKQHWYGIDKSIPIVSYKGPVALVDIPEKGRGLIAAETLDPGTLILVSKDFLYISKSVDARYFSTNVELGKHHHFLDEIIFTIANRIALDPEIGKEFYRLTAGKDFLKQENPNNGLVDIKRIHRIRKLNAFGKIEAADKTQSHPSVFRICILPSFMNHSCLPNCIPNMMENFVILKTVKAVNKGEELTIMYSEPRTPFEQRKAYLRNNYGFECNCELCVVDASEPKSVHDQRATLLEVCGTHVNSAPDKVLNAIKEIINLGNSKPELNMALVDEAVHYAIEKFVRDEYEIKDCIKIIKNMIQVLENNPCMYNQLCEVLSFSLLECFIRLKYKKNAEDCVEKIEEIVRAYDGKWGLDYFKKNPQYQDTLNRVSDIPTGLNEPVLGI